MNPEQYKETPPPTSKTHIAWVIESTINTDMCLGVASGHFIVWTVPNLAFQFARKQDAQAIAALLLNPVNAPWKVEEHVWS